MSNTQNVKLLTKDVLDIVAPEEIFLLANYAPDSEQSGVTSKGPQGFGGLEAAVLVLPFVYKFFEKFLERVATRTADSSYKLLQSWFSDPKEEDKLGLVSSIRSDLLAAGMNESQVPDVTRAILISLRKSQALLSPPSD